MGLAARKRDSAGIWGNFSAPAQWAVYIPGRDGPGAEFVFQTTTTDAAPALIQLTADVMQLDDQVPTGWEDDPQGVDATNQYEWVSQRTRDSTGVWSEFSSPAQWAVYIPGSTVHDIGSATQPAANLGKVGDTAINDAGMYWFKEAAGWDLRGDLTDGHVYFSDDLIAAGHAGTLPPPDAFGFDNDIAVGPDGRVMRRVAGAWVDVELEIPAPVGVSAVVTILASDILNVIGTVYDLRVQWVGANYMTEVEIGFIPAVDVTNLTGAAWGHYDGVSGTDFHDFLLIRQSVIAGRAVRARHIGSFGQRGDWAYALYSSDTTLAIDSFAADNTDIESGDTVTLTWTIRNATSASINQGVGTLSSSQLESGSVQVNPTATTTYILTATDGTDTVTASVTVTVGAALAQPSITSFTVDDATLTPTQTTTVRWAGVNGVSGTITGPSLNRALTTAELTAGTQSIGPLSAGIHPYQLTLNGEAGTTPATRSFSVVSSTTPPPPDPVTIDTFTRVPSTIESGESSLLSWTTSNATAVTLDGATVTADGSMSVSADIDDRLRSTGYRRGRAGDAERDGHGDRDTAHQIPRSSASRRSASYDRAGRLGHD